VLTARTRRYAAYQRKWMRRIPGLVSIDGNRPPEEVAADIISLVGSVVPAG
jgi:thymidylate kinase